MVGVMVGSGVSVIVGVGAEVPDGVFPTHPRKNRDNTRRTIQNDFIFFIC
jgi:hypothetical protein